MEVWLSKAEAAAIHLTANNDVLTFRWLGYFLTLTSLGVVVGVTKNFTFSAMPRNTNNITD